MARFFPRREELSQRWLSQYGGEQFTLAKSSSPIIPAVQTAKRTVGDRLCWVIEYDEDCKEHPLHCLATQC